MTEQPEQQQPEQAPVPVEQPADGTAERTGYPPVLDTIWNFLREHWWWAIPVFFALSGSRGLFWLSVIVCGTVKWRQHANRPLPPEQAAARDAQRAARREDVKEWGKIGGMFALAGLIRWVFDSSGRRAARREASWNETVHRANHAGDWKREQDMRYLRKRWVHEAKQREKRERGPGPFNW